MGKHLVLAGGGHAHMTVMLRLDEYVERGHRVTLVSPSRYHYYSGMGPGLLGGTYRPQQIRFHVRRMVEKRGATFIEDRVVRIESDRRRLLLASGDALDYDVASFNTGSGVSLAAVGAEGADVVPVKPIHNLLAARRTILERLRSGPLELMVVGGGPAGVEVAGNLWRLVVEAGGDASIVLLAGSRLLRHFPEKVRDLATASFERRGIKVIEGPKATRVSGRRVELTDGVLLPYDMAFIATGVEPSSLFRDSGLPVGEDGGLLVNDRLQSTAWPELFGGGDCISLKGHPLAKVGVYAVRQNPILYHNLLAALEEGELIPFQPQPHYLLIFNLGNRRGILVRKNLAWEGLAAFLLKDWIDRRFMGKFQVSEELTEGEGG
jgi:NADH dehydrogenase FAD-containing subunit